MSITGLSQRDLAREYFYKKGLNFYKLNEADIQLLKSILEYVIKNNPQYYWKGVNDYFVDVGPYGEILHAEITGFGEYFDKRELVTFYNDEHYIGLSGPSDTNNIIPVIEAFKLWCDTIANYKGLSETSDN